MPEGIKVLENPASCVFFVYIHESSCELVDLCFERHFSFFYQDFLFERSSFYFQFYAKENELRTFSTTRLVRLRVRSKSTLMLKTEVAGFIQCSTRSRNQ